MFADMPIGIAFRKWDKHLLLNYPRLWALRLPLLSVYFLLGNGLALLISGLLPLKPYQADRFFFWLWLFTLLEVILLILWIVRFNHHSPEKSLERTIPLNGLAEVALYMLCVAIFLSPAISSSFVLEHRFAQLLPYRTLLADKYLIKSSEYDAVYSQELVERYSPLDYETYRKNSASHDIHRNDNAVIRSSIYTLEYIVKGTDDSWEYFLVFSAVLLHIGVLMFSSRHLRKGAFGKTVIYAIVVFILALIVDAIGIYLVDTFHQGSNLSWSDIYDLVNSIVLGATFLLFVIFSLRVFWQKRYKAFTAMNISLLPYGVYVGAFFLEGIRPDTFEFIDNLFSYKGWLSVTFGNFWGDLLGSIIIGSPVLILWVFILTKAMYTRLLALPEG